jgi:GDP-D-mannose 3', 5'-epimerase
MNFWKDRKVLVTGGAGFIGSHVVERLVDLGARVRVVDSLERGSMTNLEQVAGSIEFEKGDLREADVSRRTCSGIDTVFHLASRVGGIKFYLQHAGEVLIDNTLIDTNMLKAARDAGVCHYLYASSAHVYPIELQMDPQSPLIAENQASPANPELSYGWGKLIGEKQIEYAIAERGALRAAIVRIIGAYGPRQDLDLATGSAIPVFLRRAIEYPKRKPFTVLGTGLETRSYCYISDVVDALMITVQKTQSHELVGPLNLGREDRVTIRELAEEVIRLSGKEIEITWDPSTPTVIWGQALEGSLARNILDGWTPRVELQEGLRRTYSYAENQLNSAIAPVRSSK